MDAATLETIPEYLRGHYSNVTKNPNAMSTLFRVRKEVEDTKEKIRASSRLYSIFGEDGLSFTKDSGELNLEIRLGYPNELHEELMREQHLLEARIDILAANEAVIESKDYPKVEVNLSHGVKGFISFGYADLITQLKTSYEDINEAIVALNKLHDLQSDQAAIYMDKFTTDEVSGMTNLLRDIQNQHFTPTHMFYMRYNIIGKVLDKAINGITWHRELKAVV